MPSTGVVFFREGDGTVPVLDWLKRLRRTNVKAFAKCLVRVERLAELGHDLRRPEADLLRDGIHELRARCGSVQYRLLYFFTAGTCVCWHTRSSKKARFQLPRSTGRSSVGKSLLRPPLATLTRKR